MYIINIQSRISNKTLHEVSILFVHMLKFNLHVQISIIVNCRCVCHEMLPIKTRKRKNNNFKKVIN